MKIDDRPSKPKNDRFLQEVNKKMKLWPANAQKGRYLIRIL